MDRLPNEAANRNSLVPPRLNDRRGARARNRGRQPIPTTSPTAKYIATASVYARALASTSSLLHISPAYALPLVSHCFRALSIPLLQTHSEIWCKRDARLLTRPPTGVLDRRFSTPSSARRRLVSLVLGPQAPFEPGTYVALLQCRATLTTLNVSFDDVLLLSDVMAVFKVLRLLRARFVRFALEHVPLFSSTREICTLLACWARAGLETFVYLGRWKRFDASMWASLEGVWCASIRGLGQREDLRGTQLKVELQALVDGPLKLRSLRRLEIDEVEPLFAREFVRWGRGLGDRADVVRWAVKGPGARPVNGQMWPKQTWYGLEEEDTVRVLQEATDVVNERAVNIRYE